MKDFLDGAASGYTFGIILAVVFLLAGVLIG